MLHPGKILILIVACLLFAAPLSAATGPQAPIGGEITCRNIGRLIVKAERRLAKFIIRREKVVEKYERFAERYRTTREAKKERLQERRDQEIADHRSCHDNRVDPDDDSRECKRSTQKVRNLEHKIGRVQTDPEETHKSRLRDRRLERMDDRIVAFEEFIAETLIPFKDECEAEVPEEDEEGGEDPVV